MTWPATADASADAQCESSDESAACTLQKPREEADRDGGRHGVGAALGRGSRGEAERGGRRVRRAPDDRARPQPLVRVRRRASGARSWIAADHRPTPSSAERHAAAESTKKTHATGTGNARSSGWRGRCGASSGKQWWRWIAQSASVGQGAGRCTRAWRGTGAHGGQLARDGGAGAGSRRQGATSSPWRTRPRGRHASVGEPRARRRRSGRTRRS